jgi:hypothetical protein
MATTWEFFYTVEVYHDLEKLYDDTKYQAGFDVLVDEFTSGTNSSLLRIHNEYRPSEAGSGVVQDTNGFYTKPVAQTGPYRTYSKMPIKANLINYVRFYMQEKQNGVIKNTFWLPKNVLSEIKIIKPEGKENMIDLGTIVQVKSNRANATTGAPETSGAPSRYPGVKVNNQGGTTFRFRTTFLAAGAGKDFSPPFTMSAKFKPQDYDNYNYAGVTLNTSVVTVAITKCAGVNPAVRVTAAKLPTDMPETIKNWSMTGVTVEGKPGISGTSEATVVYDACGEDGTGKTPRWIGVKTQNIQQPNPKNEYLYTIVTCGTTTDTTLKVVVKPTTEPQQKTGPVVWGFRPGKTVDAWRKKQYEAIIGNCTTKAITEQDDDDDTTVRPPVETQLPTDKLRWNPPPHRVTSTESFGTRMSTLYEEASNWANLNTQERYNFTPEFVAMAEAAAKGKYSKFEKLRIFQDAYGAKSLNRAYKKTAKAASGTAGNNQLWGFRATYNPTTFSYSTAANTDVDWTLGAKDPAILLAGNQTVSFDLYLNRIADLSAINPKNGVDLSKTSSMYPRQLEREEADGIYHRGTEYDLEFLYRVITGDPEKKNLLLSPAYRNLGGVTADLGYTTAVPCWLYLNENMRYYGSVASIQVNHVMFDLRMVPMLSVATITFARYPATDQGAEPKKIREKQQGIAADTKS